MQSHFNFRSIGKAAFGFYALMSSISSESSTGAEVHGLKMRTNNGRSKSSSIIYTAVTDINVSIQRQHADISKSNSELQKQHSVTLESFKNYISKLQRVSSQFGEELSDIRGKIQKEIEKKQKKQEQEQLLEDIYARVEQMGRRKQFQFKMGKDDFLQVRITSDGSTIKKFEARSFEKFENAVFAEPTSKWRELRDFHFQEAKWILPRTLHELRQNRHAHQELYSFGDVPLDFFPKKLLPFIENKWSSNRDDIMKQTKLVVLESIKGDDKKFRKAREHLKKRFPFNYDNAPHLNYFDHQLYRDIRQQAGVPVSDKKLSVVFSDEKYSVNALVSSPYGILGRMYAKNQEGGERKGDYFAFHTWGLNFESGSSAVYTSAANAYELEVAKPDLIGFNTYVKNWYSEVFLLIKAAAGQAKKWTEKKTLEVRIPGIGIGNFLNELKELDSFWERQGIHGGREETVEVAFFEAYRDVFNFGSNQDDDIAFVYVVPGKNNEEVRAQLQTTGTPVANYTGTFPRGDLFACNEDVEKAYLLVNAWDDRSLIGNLGAADQSIDGFFVAGHSFGEKIQNTSYLHNPIYHGYFDEDDQVLGAPDQHTYESMKKKYPDNPAFSFVTDIGGTQANNGQ